MVHDFTGVPALSAFPWESVYDGLARSKKTVTTFYGDVHSTKFTHTARRGWADRDQWRWFNALRHGVGVEGFNVGLTGCVKMEYGDHWWARSHQADFWRPTDDMRHFAALQEWLRHSGIFESTGRQVFFIQINGQHSPVHTDFDPAGVPEELRAPGEFIWLTPPDRPKQLKVSGVEVPWCCWFNHFDPHGSDPATDTRWSLRIDGVFTQEFRNKYARTHSNNGQ